jgi:hypothetical protein
MQTINFEEVLDKILAKDPRIGGTPGLCAALWITCTSLQPRLGRSKLVISPDRILRAIRAYVLELYGPMAKALLNE